MFAWGVCCVCFACALCVCFVCLVCDVICVCCALCVLCLVCSLCVPCAVCCVLCVLHGSCRVFTDFGGFACVQSNISQLSRLVKCLAPPSETAQATPPWRVSKRLLPRRCRTTLQTRRQSEHCPQPNTVRYLQAVTAPGRLLAGGPVPRRRMETQPRVAVVARSNWARRLRQLSPRVRTEQQSRKIFCTSSDCAK